MPLVPEKLGARQEVRCAVCAQFWEQPVQSSKSSDGLARTLPCEPPPLSLTSPTGLNRTQELLAIQALGIPCMPAFDADGGGVVLDRVLGKVGGFGWWTALSARAKAQAMWKAHQGGAKAGDVLKDLNNYSLTARNRFSLGKNTAINTVVEVPNVHNAWHRLRGRDPHSTSDQATTSAPGDTADSSSQPPLTKGRVWAKHDTTHHELMASAAWGQEYLDSAASYCPVPLTLSMDVASKARADGMQYRAGVHQVYAAESEGVDSHARAASESAEPSGGPPAARPPLRSSLHFQGAVAVEGEAVLWKPKPKSPWASTPATPRGFPFSDRDGNRQASYNVDHGDAFQAQPYSDEKPWWDQGPMLGNISADAVQSSIRGVTASAEGVRGELRAMTCHIQDGLLQQNPPAPKRRRWQPRRRPYSPWLASPYVKANASVGCLARIPLPHRAFRPLRFRRTPSGQNAGEAPPAAQEHSRFAKELWTPFLRGTALRLFSSTGISAQAGTFTRPLLDYSAASLRLDLGLTSPVVPRRGIWHAISASFTQQLVGPLRGRVDLRFALDLPSVIAPEDIGGRRTWGAIINAVAAVRPSLLETVYGLDYIIPNTQGAARLAVWYAPMRKEAMLGMRLF
ncbi:hypothetical protein WJX72_006721 [[Myrmecia] bisecta]|uniref:Uncharacterized protein n=1 Tax=[Myrmecia] bisecta TaxID=41462 RepID=A0AAW1PEJ5_9CHLO